MGNTIMTVSMPQHMKEWIDLNWENRSHKIVELIQIEMDRNISKKEENSEVKRVDYLMPEDIYKMSMYRRKAMVQSALTPLYILSQNDPDNLPAFKKRLNILCTRFLLSPKEIVEKLRKEIVIHKVDPSGV